MPVGVQCGSSRGKYSASGAQQREQLLDEFDKLRLSAAKFATDREYIRVKHSRNAMFKLMAVDRMCREERRASIVRRQVSIARYLPVSN